MSCNLRLWGFSSAGRAPALQAGGQRFDPANLHQEKRLTEVPWRQETSLSLLGSGTNQKPSEAGFDWRGETKAQWRFEIEYFKTEIVTLISTTMHLEN